MTCVARYLAGPGAPETALDVLKQARWLLADDEAGNTFAFAPDRRVIVAFLPETNDFAPGGPLWVIRAYLHGDFPDIAWEATFTNATPAELIAGFLTELANPAPLDDERGT
ncbi:hypothetical protein GCM10029978_046420 [Actinoallomurus acanthiterrae]